MEKNKICRDEFFRLYAAGEKNFGMAQLEGSNLRGLHLEGASFYRANLKGADLREANLKGAIFYDAILTGADLRSANLEGAQLDYVKMGNANLSDANLSGAELDSTDLEGTNFSGANLYGADLYAATLKNANLSGANLVGANLESAGFDGADLTYTNLIGAINVDIDDAIIQNTIMPDGSTVVISDIDENRINFLGCKYPRNLYLCDLRNANLLNASGAAFLGEAIFCNTIMPDGSIRNDDCEAER